MLLLDSLAATHTHLACLLVLSKLHSQPAQRTWRLLMSALPRVQQQVTRSYAVHTHAHETPANPSATHPLQNLLALGTVKVHGLIYRQTRCHGRQVDLHARCRPVFRCRALTLTTGRRVRMVEPSVALWLCLCSTIGMHAAATRTPVLHLRDKNVGHKGLLGLSVSLAVVYDAQIILCPFALSC